MPYGQFTSYEPAGKPGAYNFGLADGRSVSLFGPEAEDLRAKIDASNAAMPQPTAQNMSTADQNMSVPDAQGGQNMSVGTPQVAPPPAPTVIPETTVQPTAASGTDRWGYKHMPDGTIIDPTKVSAPRTKASMEKRKATGVAMPTGETETVRGGFEQSADFLEGMADVSIDERMAADQRAEWDMVIAEQAAQVARDQQVQAAAQAAEAQRQALAAEVRVNRDQQIKDAAFKDYAEARIDPNRMFRGSGGTAKAIGAALSSGLGAFGAALTKTPNFAQQLIDAAIERDIRGQEAEIAVKKQAADNALVDLNKSGLTMEQSKGLLRQLQKEYAAKQAATLVAGNQIPEVMQRHQEWMTEHQKQRLMFEESYRQQSLGEATKTVASQVQYAGGGSSGVVSPGQRIATAQAVANLEATGAKKSTGNGTGEHSKGRQMADIDAAEAALARLEAEHQKGGKSGVFHSGYGGTDYDQKMGAAVDALAPGLGRALEGNAPNESTMQGIRKGLLSPSGDKMGEAIRSYRQQLQDRRKALESSGD